MQANEKIRSSISYTPDFVDNLDVYIETIKEIDHKSGNDGKGNPLQEFNSIREKTVNIFVVQNERELPKTVNNAADKDIYDLYIVLKLNKVEDVIIEYRETGSNFQAHIPLHNSGQGNGRNILYIPQDKALYNNTRTFIEGRTAIYVIHQVHNPDNTRDIKKWIKGIVEASKDIGDDNDTKCIQLNIPILYENLNDRQCKDFAKAIHKALQTAKTDLRKYYQENNKYLNLESLEFELFIRDEGLLKALEEERKKSPEYQQEPDRKKEESRRIEEEERKSAIDQVAALGGTAPNNDENPHGQVGDDSVIHPQNHVENGYGGGLGTQYQNNDAHAALATEDNNIAPNKRPNTTHAMVVGGCAFVGLLLGVVLFVIGQENNMPVCKNAGIALMVIGLMALVASGALVLYCYQRDKQNAVRPALNDVNADNLNPTQQGLRN